MERRTVKVFYHLLDLIKKEENEGNKNEANKTKITVITGNMFEEAVNYEKPLIHNFANNVYPGGPSSKFTPEGEWISTSPRSNTQEDQLIKRYQNKIHLPTDFYPICKDEEIDGEAILYSRCLDLPAVITIASLVDPDLSNQSEYDSMLHRILLMLYVATFNEHTLVTGLWGCGVFGMNPEELVEMWKHALRISKYQPKEIVFCIYLDHFTQKFGDLHYYRKLFNQISK